MFHHYKAKVENIIFRVKNNNNRKEKNGASLMTKITSVLTKTCYERKTNNVISTVF
jgi:hypothetical protein